MKRGSRGSSGEFGMPHHRGTYDSICKHCAQSRRILHDKQKPLALAWQPRPTAAAVACMQPALTGSYPQLPLPSSPLACRLPIICHPTLPWPCTAIVCCSPPLALTCHRRPHPSFRCHRRPHPSPALLLPSPAAPRPCPSVPLACRHLPLPCRCPYQPLPLPALPVPHLPVVLSRQ